jgi:hypothetical protein
VTTEQAQATETEVRMFPALKTMERNAKPLRNGREPYWRPPVTPASRDFYGPAWNWHHPIEFPQDAKEMVLDANGAYLASIGSVAIAHSELVNAGAIDHNPDPRDVAPGYYRIAVPHWSFAGTIVSPLGDSSRVQTESQLWVAAPTLVLLLELERDGYLGAVTITDSWTARVTTSFRSWSDRLRAVRTECLDRIDLAHTAEQGEHARARYDAFKTGYSAALSMMLTGEKCHSRRPDWAHTVYAQHSASMWRKAWRYTFSGLPLVSMGHTDEIAILAGDLHEALARPKPPFRYDPTGRSLGALKMKSIGPVGGAPQHAESVPLTSDEDEDIL